ncbi:hypothetical protein LCGC14_0340050 [marine sediment metagenome]|uniref:Uncharacterized protein n=1 Tax=marine sediment metagenome TaxID=412755 RepID=A0A0F9WLJ8_9ZZZZ
MLAMASTAVADGPQAADLVGALFGHEIAEATATRGEQDNLTLARQMLQVARSAQDDPELLGAICQAIHDLVVEIDGAEDLVIQAMDLAAGGQPAGAVGARKQVVAMWQRQLPGTSGAARQQVVGRLLEAMLILADAQAAAERWFDASMTVNQATALTERYAERWKPRVAEAGRQLEVREEAAEEIRELQAGLKADPNDRKARARLIHLYLVVLDDPAAAAAPAAATSDEVLRTYVPLAAKGPGDVAAAAAVELGRWYQSLAAGSEGPAEAAMLRRAAGYFRRVIAGEGEGEIRRQAAEQLSRVNAALAEMTGLTISADRSVALVGAVDLRIDAVEGSWRLIRSSLDAQQGERSRLDFPIVIDGSYHLGLKVMRRSGTGELVIVLPVADRHVMLVIDASGASGLTQIGGRGLKRGNATLVHGRRLTNGKGVRLDVVVERDRDEVTIDVNMDNRSLVEWAGSLDDLSMPKDQPPGRRGQIAIGVIRGGAAFTDIRLQMTDGVARRTGPRLGGGG